MYFLFVFYIQHTYLTDNTQYIGEFIILENHRIDKYTLHTYLSDLLSLTKDILTNREAFIYFITEIKKISSQEIQNVNEAIIEYLQKRISYLQPYVLNSSSSHIKKTMKHLCDLLNHYNRTHDETEMEIYKSIEDSTIDNRIKRVLEKLLDKLENVSDVVEYFNLNNDYYTPPFFTNIKVYDNLVEGIYKLLTFYSECTQNKDIKDNNYEIRDDMTKYSKVHKNTSDVFDNFIVVNNTNNNFIVLSYKRSIMFHLIKHIYWKLYTS